MDEFEPVKDEQLDELVSFIITMRVEPERTFWFIGKYTESDNEEDTLISESMRGEFEKGVWNPLEVEKRACCKGIKTDANPFALMAHCCDEKHIRALLADLEPPALRREYDYMLTHVYDSLTADWQEMV